jgi:hypothetical protein
MDSQLLALGMCRGLEGLLQQRRDETAGGGGYQQHRRRPGFERTVDAAVQDGRPRSRGRAVRPDREGAASSAVQLACDGGDGRRRTDYSQRKVVWPRLVVGRHIRADENKNQRQHASQDEQDLPVAGRENSSPGRRPRAVTGSLAAAAMATAASRTHVSSLHLAPRSPGSPSALSGLIRRSRRPGTGVAGLAVRAAQQLGAQPPSLASDGPVIRLLTACLPRRRRWSPGRC